MEAEPVKVEEGDQDLVETGAPIPLSLLSQSVTDESDYESATESDFDVFQAKQLKDLQFNVSKLTGQIHSASFYLNLTDAFYGIVLVEKSLI